MSSAELAPAPLAELARCFARLGVSAFGGPAVHIALFEAEFVVRRRWLDRARFLELLGVASLLPGPTSTELALHIGYERAGWRGLLVAGAAFIAPAAVLTAALAAAYQQGAALGAVQRLLVGVQPMVLAIVAAALVRLAPSALAAPWQRGLAAAACLAAVGGLHELLVLLLAALVPVSRPTTARTVVDPLTLGLLFAKIGALLFGSGYVLLAFLQTELVARRGWLTEAQLLDVVALGQLTPGPLFTTATAAGWLLGGGPGAIAATIGIFLPAFCLGAVGAPLVRRLRGVPWATGALERLAVASLGLMAAVLVPLGRDVLIRPLGAGLALAGLALLLATRLNPVWLLAAGAAVGLAAG